MYAAWFKIEQLPQIKTRARRLRWYSPTRGSKYFT